MKTEILSECYAGLLRSCTLLALVAVIYWASVGPAYRLYCHQLLPSKALSIYRPIVSLKSPFFNVTFRYVILWM
jgi:hypothetical protein